jgi:bifunctional non-homologous end joining protein LigD
MLATSATLPLPRGDWRYEFKWDGMRLAIALEGGATRLFSRIGRDVTATYPELGGLAREVGVDAWLDGEAVALDEKARPDFGHLQHRMHVGPEGPPAGLVAAVPVHLFLFDVLRLDGHDLTGLPYTARRATLESLDLGTGPWRVPPTVDAEAEVALDAAERLGLEGIVAKEAGSVYHPGRRSASWRKVKLFARDEFVVGGWSDGSGRRERGIGSLLLGAHDETLPGRPMRYVGNVGTGFSDAVLDDLLRRLAPLETGVDPFGAGPPRPKAHFVRPELVGEVAYGQWTSDVVLRHPSWEGLRSDRDPADVSLPGTAHDRTAPPAP